jgi:hypothetical protein
VTSQVHAERELKEVTQVIEQKISQRTAQLERLNEELAFRARETEKVNTELIFINERLQLITRQQSAASEKSITSAAPSVRERNPEASM